MEQYNHANIEAKWQKKWADADAFAAPDASTREKRYVLDMFPYPSGDGLHVGHVEGYTATDIYSRYLRMNGYSVLHPMGWDAFGLPAENYAIKTGIHPRETTEKAIKTFTAQIKSLGLSYDWQREIGTHRPEYYRWTQWFFLLLFAQGLAYKANANVNWCPSCQTVLANEQVEEGVCERCKNEVEQREMEQWFFKITEYADRLVDELDDVDWPESTKRNQRNWIGRSHGADLRFTIKDLGIEIPVFTTRPDTLFGATYMVLSPEHEILPAIQEKITNKDEVTRYIKQAKKKTELERTKEEKEKTGVKLEGVSAVNPATNETIPVFVADYVLAHYGTGAIMAVPAHDERDFAFAEKYGLEIRDVVSAEHAKRPYAGEGVLINSGDFNGMDTETARETIAKHVGGELKTTYKLRDWLVSRQRYWGAPIPIVYDPDGKPHPVPEEHLPWELPTDVEFKPHGTSPLAESKELFTRTEELFGKGWTPEVDTLDTFVDSSWYFFRFADPQNSDVFAGKDKIKKWLPVDLYMGGAEHTVLHLMYARFFTKVLADCGYIAFVEPFQKLRHQGIVLAEDGHKMSKSRGNVINPTAEVERLGADTVRLYEMFMGPLEDTKPWSSESIVGVRRFLERVWRLAEKTAGGNDEPEAVTRELHKTVKKVTDDIVAFKFNTAISQMMIFVNTAEKASVVSEETFSAFLRVLAPFAPHVCEELWARAGNETFIQEAEWPAYDEALIESAEISVPVQIDGKVRAQVTLPKAASEEEAFAAIPEETAQKWIGDTAVKKQMYVPGKIISIVTENGA